MRLRRVPREIPSSALYLAIEVPGLDPSETHWRLPFPVHGARLVSAMQAASIAAPAGSGDLVRLDAALNVWFVGGAAVGYCWHHRLYDLDTRREDFGGGLDLVGYGEAVLDELHEVGWTMIQLGAIYPRLFGAMSEALSQSVSEVTARAGFSGPPRAGAN